MPPTIARMAAAPRLEPSMTVPMAANRFSTAYSRSTMTARVRSSGSETPGSTRVICGGASLMTRTCETSADTCKSAGRGFGTPNQFPTSRRPMPHTRRNRRSTTAWRASRAASRAERVHRKCGGTMGAHPGSTPGCSVRGCVLGFGATLAAGSSTPVRSYPSGRPRQRGHRKVGRQTVRVPGSDAVIASSRIRELPSPFDVFLSITL